MEHEIAPHSHQDGVREAAHSEEQEQERTDQTSLLEDGSEKASSRDDDGETNFWKRIYYDTWACEIAAIVFSIACMIALGVVLFEYDGNKTPHIRFGTVQQLWPKDLSRACLCANNPSFFRTHTKCDCLDPCYSFQSCFGLRRRILCRTAKVVLVYDNS
jgi:hypothetical protein